MTKKRIVVALGGNALGNNAEEQLNLVKNTAGTIVDLIEQGYEVIVGHGNGPQVEPISYHNRNCLDTCEDSCCFGQCNKY